MSTPDPGRWRPTAALYRATAFATAAIGLGIAFGRPDIAVLGIPFALLLVLALSVRQPGPGLPRASARVEGEVFGDRPATVATDVVGLDGVQLVTLRTPDQDGAPGGGFGTMAGGADGTLSTRTRTSGWGVMPLARPDLVAAGPDALYVAGPVIGEALRVTVPPAVEKVDGLQLPPIMGGWAGEHRSRRPGQGGDLIDLREFMPGDRLRSIHWRAYARHQRLFVRRTQSDADTEFVLCLDTRFEILPQTRGALTGWQRFRQRTVRSWSRLRLLLSGLIRVAEPMDGRDPSIPRSSIDFTVAAAAAITATQLRAGDRVGVLDLAHVRRHVRMGSGSRHLQRVRYQLALVRGSKLRWMPMPELWGLPSSAVVVLISPMIDDVAMQAGLDAAGRGHQVLVVDALPVHELVAAARTDHFPHAVKEVQLLLAERDVRLDRLRAKGIPVLTWDQGQIATDLAAVMRLRRHRR
ncbi:Uncharacterized conserved protein, DUF58 family, contains vWF domain [Nakamurella panacisegetis]|uniref:Uncharacterized conserved protein, DUF58 family, contains vWF domain n=1 Tax=Nakamurella panacisegetis TaxID=1090615 RepID=A0A1H0PE86_9ACTN|nr:DUF58 domain-containing protein [Nakamurella panacisegetis]SDP03402.1 Uncharacterized conserved protein, DUF58 family, contains vWF domain [Nakamurella panacisegetis]